MKSILYLIAGFLGILVTLTTQGKQFEKIIFSSLFEDFEDFEDFSKRAKESGATHVTITSSLPRSSWQYDTPGDPYPAWYVIKASLLKIATPSSVQKYIPQDYAEEVLDILEKRCIVLRKYGLKAHFGGCDPAVLPEAVYQEHPLWRGPRVDHPSRSRAARFAPSVENPEVQALYREAVSRLLKKCPEIDIITMLTNDSGAGLDWSPGLYDGQLGNTLYKNNSMADRINTFFNALKQGAADVGAELDIRMGNTREKEPERIATKISKGMAVENFEGPDASPFSVSAGVQSNYGNMFTPVYGIPQPVQFVSTLINAKKSKAKRLFISFTDHITRDLYFEVYDRLKENQINDQADELVFIKDLAGDKVGSANASELMELWTNIQEAADYIDLFHTGGRIYNLGCVQQRWLIRPFVPYPEELPEEISKEWQKYQFQALPEWINNLANMQAGVYYYGWSARHFVGKVTDRITKLIDKSIAIADKLNDQDLSVRLKVFNCIANNAYHAISYQAQLDRVKEFGIKPLDYSVNGTQSGWDRQLMMMTARAEIDNTALLMKLLGDDPGRYMQVSKNLETKDIMLYGPDIIKELQRKINMMNDHWEDYKRMFTTPNL